MSITRRTLTQHLGNDGQPKRILALDGGGLRGIVSLAILETIEDKLRRQHGADDDFRLSDYFDLIAGTSTGAIIAAALAMGWKVKDLREKYLQLGNKVFEKGFLRFGLVRAKYDNRKLIRELQGVYGKDTTLGSNKILTGLLVVTKRLDSGSFWPLSNNPRGKYFATRKTEAAETIGNGEYPLWQVVRASTAAPSYFEPQDITITRAGKAAVRGEFVDGGMSPFNNPALMAVMYATLSGYRVNWTLGASNLFVVSVGTGSADPDVKRSSTVAAAHAVQGLLGLMDDSAVLQEIVLQWMSTSRTARSFDREIGDLVEDRIGPEPLLSYVRYNASLNVGAVRQMRADLDDRKIASLTAMDAPANMEILHDIGAQTARRDVRDGDFPERFKLPG
jgi:predicted acylesterase/phospholipase RssA